MSFESLGPVFMEGVSAVTATNSVEVGTRRTVAGNDYIYVYNAGTDQIPVGNGAIVTAATGYSVIAGAVTMVDFGVGVCKHTTIPAASYGWLLTRGFSGFNAGASDSFAVGNPLALAVSGVFANKTISTGYVTPVVGRCISACASGLSGGTGYAYFNFGS
jgi:hypothetical protein